MRQKLLNLPKPILVITGAVFVGVFLLLLNIGGRIVSGIPALGQEYVVQCIGELVAAVYTIAMLFLLGYGSILKEKGTGFLKGFYVGGFMVGYCLFAAVAMLYVQQLESTSTVQPVGMICIYTLTMFLVGLNEEVIVRGVVLNLLLDRFTNSRKGVLWAIILSSLIFGCCHIPNVMAGIPFKSVLIQTVQATLMGIVFAAIYLRSGNIWICIIAHAAVDFAGLMASGVFGNGGMTDMIGNLSIVNLVVTVPLFLIPGIVLLRKNKLEEIVRKRVGEEIIPTQKEADHTAIVSIVLGGIGIVLGISGYTIGISLVGLLGAIVSKKIKTQQNGFSMAAMIVSIVGLVISIMGMILMMIMMPMIGDANSMGIF